MGALKFGVEMGEGSALINHDDAQWRCGFWVIGKNVCDFLMFLVFDLLRIV